MSIPNYGVLKGAVIDCMQEFKANSPHYQVKLRAGSVDYRISVNVKSVDTGAAELLFYVDENFTHPILPGLLALPAGYTSIPSRPGGLALDFIRENLVDRAAMRKVPHNIPGPDNDLNELFDHYVGRAKRNGKITIYAFGSKWGPEKDKKDEVFGFKPGNGIHDIHMNQGNPLSGGHAGDNGPYQDGALMIHMAPENRWVAIFLAFQSQEWHTTEDKGNPEAGAPGQRVKIIAALVDPKGTDARFETVTLLNPSSRAIDLKGWKLLDRLNNFQSLSGVLPAGDALRVKLNAIFQLGNGGGTITLLDAKGLKVDGVAYTAAGVEGETVVF